MIFEGMLQRKHKYPVFHEARESEHTYQPASSFEEQSRIFPALKQSNISLSRMISRKQQPLYEKTNREVKHTTLTAYDTNLDVNRSKTCLGVPNFRSYPPRKTYVGGVNMGMIDPTGHAFIEESQRGFEGQNYGMASYKKGL